MPPCLLLQGVGPEHSYLKDIGRAEYSCANDEEALRGFRACTQLEGIIPGSSLSCLSAQPRLTDLTSSNLPSSARVVACHLGWYAVGQDDGQGPGRCHLPQWTRRQGCRRGVRHHAQVGREARLEDLDRGDGEKTNPLRMDMSHFAIWNIASLACRKWGALCKS